MARKIGERSLFRLVGAYADAFPAEVAEALEAADAAEAAQLLEAFDLGTAAAVIEEASDEASARLLAKLSEDGFRPVVGRVHRHRLEKLKTLHAALAERLEPAPAAESAEPANND